MNPQDWVSRLTSKHLSKTEGLLLLSVVLFVISYPPSPFPFFIYIAFVPLLFLLEDKTPLESLRLGYISGLLFNLIAYYWIAHYKISSYFLLVILNSIQFSLFAVLHTLIRRKFEGLALFIFPFLWTALEFSREWGDLALNWLNIGYTQGAFLSLIQWIEMTGLNGITFWICLINLIFYLWISKEWQRIYHLLFILILSIVFAGPLIYSHFKLNEMKFSKGIKVAYIQPSIDSKQKWDKNFIKQNIETLLNLSQKKSYTESEILIWPETALPFVFQDTIPEIKMIKNFVKQNQLYLLSGILYESESKEKSERYNSAILVPFDKDSIQVYRKIKLVPMEEGLPFYNSKMNVLAPNFLAGFYEYGIHKTVFKISSQLYQCKFEKGKWYTISSHNLPKRINFSSVICLESTFPSFIRGFVKNGAEVLTVITNDEWFGYSAQPIQHILNSRFRAVENRISIIHCSNAGISGFIDPCGRIYGESGLYEKGIASGVIPLKSKTTFFTTNGDLIGILSVIISVIAVVALIFNRKVN